MESYQHHDGRTFRLGKKPVRLDPRTLRMEKYAILLPVPPAAYDWTQGVQQWGMMDNDTLGDCTCAAVGHGDQVVTLNSSEGMKTPGDQLILNLYEKA